MILWLIQAVDQVLILTWEVPLVVPGNLPCVHALAHPCVGALGTCLHDLHDGHHQVVHGGPTAPPYIRLCTWNTFLK